MGALIRRFEIKIEKDLRARKLRGIPVTQIPHQASLAEALEDFPYPFDIKFEGSL